MPRLIETSLWIDWSRARTPRELRNRIFPFIIDFEAHLAEPIIFETLRFATPEESRRLQEQFHHLPVLPTPENLWMEAAKLGQACKARGLTTGSIDLLIATIAIHHGAELITFDDDFKQIASASPLQLKLLPRANA